MSKSPRALRSILDRFVFVLIAASALTVTAAGTNVAAFSFLDDVRSKTDKVGNNGTVPPCVLVVQNNADSGAGSLRQAVLDACPGGTITFGVTGTIGITSGTITLTKDVNIVGPGADKLTISHTTPTLEFLMFFTNSGKNVSFSGVTITNPYGGSTFCGGILSNGNLTLDRVVLTGIKAGNSVAVASVNGTLLITNSTISNNTSLNQGSGVYARNSQVSIVNTTISGNSCRTQGGGVFIAAGGAGGPYALNIKNSTITNNTAGVYSEFSMGGGGISIYSDTAGSPAINATLTNTIVAGNSSHNFKLDLDGGSINAQYFSGGNNIDGDGTSPFINGVNGDVVGTSGTPLDALLAPLGYYGGPSRTHALTAGSPAVNAGTATGAPATDQRGATRVGAVDIGAFELNDTSNGGTYVAQFPNGAKNAPYYFELTAASGPFVYAVTSGSLPDGITINSAALAPTAVVSLGGTPLTAGTYNFTITATDGVNSNSTNYLLVILGPTAAEVSLGGRVTTASGQGIRNAFVTLSGGSTQESRTITTGSFGYYHFEGLTSGETYVVTVSAKRYRFADDSHIVTLSDSIADIDFMSNPQ